MLLRLHDLVLDRQEEIIDLIVLESGKARKHAFDEPLHIALTARYYGRTAHQHLDTERKLGVVPGLTRVEVNRDPKGVVGIISPWNYPFTLAAVRRPPGPARRQRGGRQARRPDHALGAARRPAAGGGRRSPATCGRSSPAPGRELGTPIIDRADYVCFTGSTRDRPADRRPVRASGSSAARSSSAARTRSSSCATPTSRRRPRAPSARRSPTPVSSASPWSGCSWPTRSTTASSSASWRAPRR